jgi:hypothetical protein
VENLRKLFNKSLVFNSGRRLIILDVLDDVVYRVFKMIVVFHLLLGLRQVITTVEWSRPPNASPMAEVDICVTACTIYMDAWRASEIGAERLCERISCAEPRNTGSPRR